MAITNGVFREMKITQKDVCDVKWEKVGWEVIMKIATTWKNGDSITFCKKKNTKLHLCYDFKYAQVKKCTSVYIRELERAWKNFLKIKQLQCLLTVRGSETIVISDFGDWYV